MRPLEKLIPFEEGLEVALAAVKPVRRTERLALSACSDRVLAEEIRAGFDIPGTDRAAMDGFACRSGDLAGVSRERARTLPVAGSAPAGAPAQKLPPGACLEIATGGVLPEGADCVVEFEAAERSGSAVRFLSEAPAGRNVIPAGSDLARSCIVLSPGDLLTPARLAAAAALGCADLLVWARPRVLVLATGDEVRPPGGALSPHEVYDSNGALLSAVAQGAGCIPERLGSVPDDPDAIREALSRSGNAEFLLLTGGSSVGTRDFGRDACQASGEILFHGLKIKPGRPTLFARLKSGTLVFGMPGYPASCLLVGYALVQRALRSCARLPERERRARASLAGPVRSGLGRRDFLPVRLLARGGHVVAESTFRGSHAVSSTLAADGYLAIPEEAEGLEAGAEVEVTLF